MSVPAPAAVQVVPEQRRALLRPLGQAQQGEDGGAALWNVAQVEEEGGQAVAVGGVEGAGGGVIDLEISVSEF